MVVIEDGESERYGTMGGQVWRFSQGPRIYACEQVLIAENGNIGPDLVVFENGKEIVREQAIWLYPNYDRFAHGPEQQKP